MAGYSYHIQAQSRTSKLGNGRQIAKTGKCVFFSKIGCVNLFLILIFQISKQREESRWKMSLLVRRCSVACLSECSCSSSSELSLNCLRIYAQKMVIYCLITRFLSSIVFATSSKPVLFLHRRLFWQSW